MGISKSAFNLLLEEAKKNSFQKKKILQLGRQHTFLTFQTAVELAKKANFVYQSPAHISLSFNEDLKRCKYIDDITLFSIIGFSKIDSMDVSSYEQPSFVHDLNKPIPIELHQQYDVIFDGGTLEHVFDVPQVLRNIHNLLKVGGRIIHCSPSHNHVDHGFYMFSPTLFYEYYEANSYKILTSYVFEYSYAHNSSWKVFEYHPGCLDVLSFGGFGKKMLGVWFVAQKQLISSDGVVPQQGTYKWQWSGKNNIPPKKSSSLRIWLKKSEILRLAVNRIRKKINQFKAKHIRLKKIGYF